MKINYNYIKGAIKAKKINLKAECQKYGISYHTVCKVLWEERDCRTSTLIFFTELLETTVDELLLQEDN